MKGPRPSAPAVGEHHRAGEGGSRSTTRPIEMVYGALARACALIAGVEEWWKVKEWPVLVKPDDASRCSICDGLKQDSEECRASGYCLACLHGPMFNEAATPGAPS